MNTENLNGLSIRTDDITLLRTFSISLLYGFQRHMFKSGLSWNFKAGLGVAFVEKRKNVSGGRVLILNLNSGLSYLLPVGKN